MSASAPRVFLVAGESSGDELGARLMRGLADATGGAAAFSGVGGPAMASAGLTSLFPMADIAVMGIGPVLARLPTLIERIRRTADAAIAADPDVVVLIDSPDFTHRVAHRLRAARPDVPIVVYVSPTVWAWRAGRARKLAGFADRLLAILPFEPEVHRILGGPSTVYVGHPVLERLAALRGARSLAPERPPMLLVLPGSRRSEIGRLMAVFGATLGRLKARGLAFDAVLPAVPHLRGEIERLAADWPVVPRLVGPDDKAAAFRDAGLALAASGTVTLELAAAAIPTVAAYRLDWLGRRVVRFIDIPPALKPIVPVRSALLPNLILGRRAVPEFIDRDCTPDALADALVPLFADGPERRDQLAAFAELEARMALPDGRRPGEAAAAAVLDVIARRTLRLP